MSGMPSARGLEWKGRLDEKSRKKYDEEYTRIFGERKPWWEIRDEKKNSALIIN